jgi:ATP-dependent Clp protease ATP-binding subunit ClpC
MSVSGSEPELRELRKLAEELARRLKERASTAHLLAALVMQPSSTSELLRERRVTPDDVLRTARGLAGDELAEPIVSRRPGSNVRIPALSRPLESSEGHP